MIREIQGKIRKIRARFEDSKEIPGAVDVIPNRVEPLDLPTIEALKEHRTAMMSSSQCQNFNGVKFEQTVGQESRLRPRS